MMRIRKNKNNSALILLSISLIMIFGLVLAFIGSNSNSGSSSVEQQRMTLISFNVDNTEYQVPKNWAWAQYVNSVYSNDFTIDDDYILLNNGIVVCENEKVLKSDRIIANANYTTIPLLSFTIDEESCKTESDMTWNDWVNSRYNKNEYAIIGNYVYSQGGVITYNNSNVLKTSTIIENASYGITQTISFSVGLPANDNESVDGVLCDCRAESDMTWSQWVNSGYNHLNIIVANTYVGYDIYYLHKGGFSDFILSSETN